ncbi:MAG TPA: hypothetical protein VK324_08265 [Tepidisphaeraceae bacterium]|nr:hypothetical protein [Tepidisphaeraceae bacterium]
MKHPTAILAAAMLLAGCRAPTVPAAPPPPVPSAAPADLRPPILGLAVPRQANPPIDPASDSPTFVNLQLYVLSVPFGTVSRNDAFWKRVNEAGIDIATYDVVQKNGIRAGTAAMADWDYFKSLLDLYPARQQKTEYADPGGAAVELPMRTSVDETSIFYLNPDNRLVGRTFDRSEGFISVAFAAVPRKPDVVRVAVCPVVRSLRKRLDFTPLHNEVEQQVVEADRLYDLRLQAEIPPGHFLVMAPSPDATWPTSLGNVFFTSNTAGEKTELVLLFVPNPIRLQSVTKQPAR